MPETLLPNSDINGLNPGVPFSGCNLMYQDPFGNTLRVDIAQFIATPTSQDFEWLEDTVYAIDEVVTYGGLWYQSLQNGNENIIPGVTVGWAAWWTIVDRKYPFQFWSAGTYIEDDVLVFYKIGTRVNIYQLKAAATRPYPSSDFEVELAAGDWEILGHVEAIEYDASVADIVVDCMLLPDIALNPSANVAGNKTVDLQSLPDHGKITMKVVTIGAGRTLNFTLTGNVMCSAATWNGSTKVLTLDLEGHYRLQITPQDGVNYLDVFYYQ